MPKREYLAVAEPRAPYGLVEVTASRKVGSKGKGKNGEPEDKPFKYDTFGTTTEGNVSALAWAQFVGQVVANPEHKLTVASWDGSNRDMDINEMYESWVYGEDMTARQAATNAEVDTWIPAGPKHDLNLVTGAIRERATKNPMPETFNVSLEERLTSINTTYRSVARAKALDPETSSYVPKNMAEGVKQLREAGQVTGEDGSLVAVPAQGEPEGKGGKGKTK